MTTNRYLYLDGELVPYADARIHVQSTAVKYGGSVFEGLRAYWNPAHEELYVFRLQEHVDRLLGSMRLMRMQHSLTREEIERSILDVLRKNQPREDVHIRQTAYLAGDGDMDDTGPVALAVDARPRKATQKPGIAVGVSSWTRIADGSMPPRIKCSANYQNGRLATLGGEGERLRRRAPPEHARQARRGAGCLLLHPARRGADHTAGDRGHPRVGDADHAPRAVPRPSSASRPSSARSIGPSSTSRRRSSFAEAAGRSRPSCRSTGCRSGMASSRAR